jgi:hypothetical protein
MSPVESFVTPESHYTPYLKSKAEPHWDLMVEPISKNRYDPRLFHLDMFNAWTRKVCTEHRHKHKAW